MIAVVLSAAGRPFYDDGLETAGILKIEKFSSSIGQY
jgi:hypothetical protein